MVTLSQSSRILKRRLPPFSVASTVNCQITVRCTQNFTSRKCLTITPTLLYWVARKLAPKLDTFVTLPVLKSFLFGLSELYFNLYLYETEWKCSFTKMSIHYAKNVRWEHSLLSGTSPWYMMKDSHNIFFSNKILLHLLVMARFWWIDTVRHWEGLDITQRDSVRLVVPYKLLSGVIHVEMLRTSVTIVVHSQSVK